MGSTSTLRRNGETTRAHVKCLVVVSPVLVLAPVALLVAPPMPLTGIHDVAIPFAAMATHSNVMSADPPSTYKPNAHGYSNGINVHTMPCLTTSFHSLALLATTSVRF